ncbi:hypothetical protein C8F01DRAFT_799985 [Mycena amicta]|nr:hypothetical protein C8F01DRAFT_799985 [Mycena amicta]
MHLRGVGAWCGPRCILDGLQFLSAFATLRFWTRLEDVWDDAVFGCRERGASGERVLRVWVGFVSTSPLVRHGRGRLGRRQLGWPYGDGRKLQDGSLRTLGKDYDRRHQYTFTRRRRVWIPVSPLRVPIPPLAIFAWTRAWWLAPRDAASATALTRLEDGEVIAGHPLCVTRL